MKRLTTEQFIKKANQIHFNKYDYSKVIYTKAKETIIIICPIHGKFEQKAYSHLSGSGCKQCHYDDTSKNLTKNTEHFITKAKEVHGDEYCYSEAVYTGNKEKLKIICKKHGAFNQTPQAHIRGQGCSKCALQKIHKRSSITTKDFIKKAQKTHGFRYDYRNTVYTSAKNKVTIGCKEHGDFQQVPYQHLRGSGCPVCGRESTYDATRKSVECFVDEANVIHSKKYDYSKVVLSTVNDRILIGCNKHGVFEQLAKLHLRGHGCKKCSNSGISALETELSEFVLSLVGNDVILNDRSVIPPYEIDIYVPSLKVAIEFDGLYWHSESKKKDKKYHLNKTLACENRGIQLIHIFENEWANKQQIVKSRLKVILGKCDGKLYARKTQIRKVNIEDEKHFLEDNHIQGYVRSNVSYGLYHNGLLVSLMTFGKPRYTKQYEWELLRFCSAKGVMVVGGASKLFKHFLTEHLPVSVVSYADKRWSQGNLYKRLGLEHVHDSHPNYFYFKNNKLNLESRVKYQKHKLPKVLDVFDPGLTEVENMRKNGYNRIFDCGNAVYVYHKQVTSNA